MKESLICVLFAVIPLFSYGQENIQVTSVSFTETKEYRYKYDVPFVSTRAGIQTEVTKKINNYLKRAFKIENYDQVHIDASPGDVDDYTNANNYQKFWWNKLIYDYEIKENKLIINYEGNYAGEIIKGVLLFDLLTGDLIKEKN